MQLLKGYKDHLRELVEECTSELETANKKLQEDITERKQAEAALRESEERFRSVVENSQAAIIIIDEAYRFIYVNPEACRISGYSRKELIGRDFRQVLDEESKGLVAERYRRRQSGEEVPPRYEFNIIRKDGEKRRMEISSAVIKDSAGEVRTVAQLLDITERKQTEAALRQSREELRKMFESVTDGISVIDLNGIVIETNQRTVEIHGYKSKDELVGRRALELIAPGDHEKVATNMRKALKEGTVRGVEYTLLRADGTEFPGELSTSVLRDASGRWVGHITIARDITERKEAEEKEKKLQQELYLARRLAAIGELAAGVAHEINNPLTGILGFSQRLLRKNPNEEFSRGLEIIHTEARRTAEVVQNLLTFARRREPRKEYSDINDIVQKALELRAYALQTSNIEVVTVLAPTLPQLMVDFPQIQEVFLNIILNAEQAISETYGKGKLIIKTRQVKDCVRISFADDGPGIHPEHLDKVFDPFFTTRAERGGTGLGLSACHGIVTEHGGRIYARSTAGRGATFFVELPLSPVETPLVR
jgi:two-component system NtrC family sensor kinase